MAEMNSFDIFFSISLAVCKKTRIFAQLKIKTTSIL